MPEIEEAIQAIRMGDPDTGRQLLEAILEEDESNPDVWLWLSTVVDNDEDREICLENVLALAPNNKIAQKGLEALKTGSFNIYTIFDELLEVEEAAGPETTFIEDFVLADGSTDDDELVMPKGMTKGKSAKKKGSSNLRIIILLGLILLIILALAGSALTYLFGSGGSGGNDSDKASPSPTTAKIEQPESPPAVESTSEPTPTDTPTPTQTPTPEPTATPTNTPFKLPTPEPTDLPTPTATQVVPPTPG